MTPVGKYIRIRNRPINEQIAHEIDLEILNKNTFPVVSR